MPENQPANERKLAGRCLCGAVHYAVADAFVYAANCHCSNCRRTTGSAFKPSAGIERDIGVSIKPGAMKFTVIPCGAQDNARLRVAPTSAPFAALYPDEPKLPSHARDAINQGLHDIVTTALKLGYSTVGQLLDHNGLVLTRDQLLERVWGYTLAGDTRTVDVHVRQLRRKLGDASPIVTVWGVGYKVAPPRDAAVSA